MRMIIVFLVLFFSCPSYGESESGPSNETLSAAEKFGVKYQDVIRLNRKLKKTVDTAEIKKEVAYAMEHDPLAFANKLDATVDSIIKRSSAVLKRFGKAETANQIEMEYNLLFRGGFTSFLVGKKEIGDHPPISDWLGKIHTKIENEIGEFWCKFFHIHDLFILNHGIPVVFKPSKYDLEDYKDHFSGHLMFNFLWDHHGVAGVVTYWIVEAACSFSTGGIGVITFACGPIASLAEHVMDKRIAPPIATRIWKRANDL